MEAMSPQTAQSREDRQPDPAHLTVIVAESEKPVRTTLVQILKEIGFGNIVEASTGSEAWTRLRAHGADFVVAGWHMPEMNGMALLKIMRAEEDLSAIPVFLVTASITKSQVIEAGEAGVTDIILLPLTLETFRRKVQAVFADRLEPRFRQAERLFQKGLDLMKQHRWEEALKAFQAVLQVHENAEVYYNLGYIKTAQGAYEEALHYFRRATQIKRDFARAYRMMGTCYLKLGRPRLAQQSFQKAAEIYMEKQMDDSAEEVFKEVLKLNPNTINVYNNLGIIYRRRGKYEMAVRQYKKAIKVNPRDENIYYNLARTYFEWRRWKKALAALTKALKINPDFAEAKALAQTVRLRLEERP
jgi:tetratricopeptide (TPR) repeat protein